MRCCAHEREAHTHWRDGSDCGSCGCRAWRGPLARRLYHPVLVRLLLTLDGSTAAPNGVVALVPRRPRV